MKGALMDHRTTSENDPKVARFWSRTAPRGECLEWTLSRTPDGYGRLSWRGVHTYAHRVAWELTVAPVPSDLWVLHHCDNPPCVRTEHLYLGTSRDNVADRDRRGRSGCWTKPERVSRGERHYRARLSEEKVRQIRHIRERHGLPYRQIAHDLGVSYDAVWAAAQRVTWKHVG